MATRVLSICLAAVVALAPFTAGRAQTAATVSGNVATFDATFRDWMKENSVEKGVLAIAYDGRLVFERGYGGQSPRQRVLLASLSKAITGRCVVHLVAEGRLRFDGKIGGVLRQYFDRYGEPRDQRIKDATVDQLLGHRAGFAASPRDLMTPQAVELLKAKSPAGTTPAELLAAALAAPLASAPGEAFRYSNIGYLVLGVMVEAVTGESYERFCGRTVLERAGIKDPTLDTQWRAFSSFGGWRLNAMEYLAFLARNKTEALEREAQHHHAATGGPSAWQPVGYALGQFTASIGAKAARIAWHSGSWGVSPATIGMHATQHASGASWFVWFTPRPGKNATDALLQRLAALPTVITAWPAHDLFPD